MDVVITARHFRPSPKLRALVEEKFRRLDQLVPPAARELHVTLIAERKLKRVEAVLGSVRITQDSDDIEAAVELAADRMKEKLRKDHDRRRQHKGRLGLRDAVDGRVTTRRVSSARRLKRESHEMNELEVEVAAARFAKSRKDFMVFVSSETGQVNVLYRRKDGELGLIEPEGEQG